MAREDSRAHHVITSEDEAHEESRLQALHDLDLLDTVESESFDRMTRMAVQMFGTPIAAVSLTDRNRQWFKSHVGTQGREIPRTGAPCAEVTRSAAFLAIPDLLEDPRFATCLLAGAGIRFYAGAPLTTRDGHVLGAMCVLDSKPRVISSQEIKSLEDLAALVIAQIELQHELGRIEHASGLPNRHQFTNDIQDHERHHKGESRVAVLVDLADLRYVNETISVLGVAYVDNLVQAATQVIKATLGSKSGLYQVSVTSFLLMMREAEGRGWLDVVDSLKEKLKTPVVCNGIPVAVEAVYGITPFQFGGASAFEILRTAVSAAQDARKAEVPYALYNTANDEANLRRFSVLMSVRESIEQPEQFTLLYQPRVNLQTGTCVSAEALLRWRHPVFGNVSPGEFIPLVETTALARPMTQMVIEKAFGQVAAWQRAGLDTHISVNISARNLEEEDFVESLGKALTRFGLSPASIELEFTESALIRHRSRVLKQLKEIRAMGIELAIDDFGTGYSSFSYLQSLPATTLKIDQSFIRDLANSARDQTLVCSMVSMAHDIGYRVVAEGVETAEAYRFLKECRCDEVQGYFIARPLSIPDFERFLHDGRDGQMTAMMKLLQQQTQPRMNQLVS